MSMTHTKTNTKTKTITKCLKDPTYFICYIFEEQGVLGEDVRTVDMVDMTMADMVDMVFNTLGSTHLEMVHSCIIL